MIYDGEILQPFDFMPEPMELPEEIKELAKIKETIQKLYLLKPEIQSLAEIVENIKSASEIDMKQVIELIELIKGLNDSNAVEILKNRYSDKELAAIKQVSTTINSIRALAEGAVAGKLKPVDVIIELYNNFSVLTEIHNNISLIVELAKIATKLNYLNDNIGLFQDTYAMKSDIEELLKYRAELTALTDKLNRLIKLSDKVEAIEKIVSLEAKITEVVNAGYVTKTELINDFYSKTTIDSKLMTKVDRDELTANYTNDTTLKSLLAQKVSTQELNSAINARKQEQAALQEAVLATSKELSNRIDIISQEVEATSNEFGTKLQQVVNSVNSTSQSMTNQLTTLTTNINAVKNELVAKDTDLETRIAEIESYVPNDTTEDNELANKNYVIDMVQNNAARGITSNATGDSFATLDALKAGPWYYQGATIDSPHTNDYAIVTADALNDGCDTRYNYDGKGWIKFQVYRSGQGWTPTTAQLQSINSGITAAKTALIDTNQTNLTNEITERKSDITDVKVLIANETSERTQAINNVNAAIQAEAKTRLDTDNAIKQSVTAEATVRSETDNELKASIATNKAEVETIIGSLETLNTDVKTSVVDCINDLHTEMHDERVAKVGDTMTGTLKIVSAGSGPLIHIEGGNKGITFNMDSDTGFMHLIPVSNNALGFEFSATTFKPRDNMTNSALGSSGNVWNDVWLTRINGKEFSAYSDTTQVLEYLSQEITPLNNKIGDLTLLNTTSKDTLVGSINEVVNEKILALSNRITVLENKQATQTVKYWFMPEQYLLLSSKEDKYIENLATNIDASDITFEYEEANKSTITIESDGRYKYHYVNGSSHNKYVLIKRISTSETIAKIYLCTTYNNAMISPAVAYTKID